MLARALLEIESYPLEITFDPEKMNGRTLGSGDEVPVTGVTTIGARACWVTVLVVPGASVMAITWIKFSPAPVSVEPRVTFGYEATTVCVPARQK